MPGPEIVGREPKTAHLIYLNREGALLTAGRDESSFNQSSIVTNAELERFEIPEFRGSARRWDDIVECIRRHFEPYDVEIVEERPIDPGYVMVMMGGEVGELLASHSAHGHITGLAPFNGRPIENAVVLVFTRTLRESARRSCETAAMEIAHAYGLDHTRSCRDLMSYQRPCGRRRFYDEPAACGEHEDRPCMNGGEAQNSHAMLLEVLGEHGTRERLIAAEREAERARQAAHPEGGQPDDVESAPAADER